MEREIKVSVIIPVYNVEKFLRESLDSIVASKILLEKYWMNIKKRMIELQ